MAIPKSKVKLTLDDDLKKGALAKSASLPGTGAGKSSTRDMTAPSTVKSDGVETSLSTAVESDLTVSAGGNTPKEFAVVTPVDPTRPSAGFNITDSRTGEPARGVIYTGNRLWTTEELDGKLDAAEIRAAGQAVPGQGGSTGPGGVPLPPGYTMPTDLRTINPKTGFPIDPFTGEDVTDGSAFDFSGFIDPETGLAVGGDTKIQPSLLSDGAETPADRFTSDLEALMERILGEIESTGGGTKLGELATVAELETLSALPTMTFTPAQATARGLTGEDIISLKDGSGNVRVGIGSEIGLIEGLSAEELGLSADEFAFLLEDRKRNGLQNERITYFLTDPGTTLPLTDPSGARLSIDPASAEGAIRGFENAREMLETTISERGNQQSKLVIADFEASLEMLKDAYSFDIDQTKLDLDAERDLKTFMSERSVIDAENQLNAERDRKWALQDTAINQEFELRIRASENQQAEFLRKMELSWIHGSMEEAAQARKDARQMELQTFQLQQQQLQLSMLGLLGQHPQLRGLIGALGIFKGQQIGGFDIDSFFNGTLPQGEIPSAQEFTRMSPSAQENLLNTLAGKYGQSPEIIAQSIRENAPTSTRRLT